MTTFSPFHRHKPKTRGEKFAAFVIGLFVAWIIWLFFAWYLSHHQPGPPRIVSCLVGPSP